MDDLFLDVPDAVHLMSLFLGRAIVDELLPPAFLTQVCESRKPRIGSSEFELSDGTEVACILLAVLMCVVMFFIRSKENLDPMISGGMSPSATTHTTCSLMFLLRPSIPAVCIARSLNLAINQSAIMVILVAPASMPLLWLSLPLD